MDSINAGLIAGSIIGATGATYAGSNSKVKKKADDNKKVEKKESGLM